MSRALLSGAFRRLAGRGLQTSAPPRPGSMRAGLQRAAARQLGIQTIIDIGASDGRWTAMAREFWPSAACLLIEANAVHEPALRELHEQSAAIDYALVAAGPQDGETWF